MESHGIPLCSQVGWSAGKCHCWWFLQALGSCSPRSWQNPGHSCRGRPKSWPTAWMKLRRLEKIEKNGGNSHSFFPPMMLRYFLGRAKRKDIYLYNHDHVFFLHFFGMNIVFTSYFGMNTRVWIGLREHDYSMVSTTQIDRGFLQVFPYIRE